MKIKIRHASLHDGFFMNLKFTDIGFISKAYGFKGEVLFVADKDVDLMEEVKRFLFLNIDNSPVPFLIETVKEKNGDFIIKFEDVLTEKDAKKLAGLQVLIESEHLTDISDLDDFNNLVGYRANDKNYGDLGPIKSIEEFPDQYIATCFIGNKEVLFPLNDDFILEIDDDEKLINLDLPNGLLDIYMDET